MTLHAAEDIRDAFAATRAFLTPFSLRRWAKLAVVVFFIGTGLSVPTPSFDASVPAEDVPDTGGADALPDDLLLIGGVVVAVVLGVGLLWWLVSSIMEFVFIESLRAGEVRLRQYWGRRWRQGVRLLGFRIALAVPMFVLVVGWLALLLVSLATDITAPAWFLAVFLFGIPVIFVAGLLVAVVHLFTTVFVVPIMVKTNSGVLAAWRQLWPSIRARWKQYLGYMVIGGVLTFASGMVVAVALGFVALLLLIPLGGVALLVFLTVPSTVGLVVLGLLVVLFVAMMGVLWAFVQVPVVTYLRYYALLVLGDIEPEFDIVPDQRAAIRREG